MDGWGKIVITSLGGAAGHGKWAHGAGAAHVRTPGTSADWPLCEVDRAPQGAWAALPLHGTDQSATWRKGWTQPRPNPSWAWTRPPQVGRLGIHAQPQVRSGRVHVQLEVGAGRVHNHPYVGSERVRAQPHVLI
jgi:hypothetical protein